MMICSKNIPIIIFTFIIFSNLKADTIPVLFDSRSPQVVFAVGEIQKALKEKGHEVRTVSLSRLSQEYDPVQIVLSVRWNHDVIRQLEAEGGTPPKTLKNEGYSIRITSRNDCNRYWVIGEDEAGAMYGGLEMAEIIRIKGFEGIKIKDQNPYMTMRGTKFNIPLDVRTPSYSDMSDAAQNNIAEMWNFEFWKDYIDHLALYRYNLISLWNLHPFPSLVKVPDYPNIALQDVKRSTVKWDENYSLNGNGFDAPEILNNTQILKTMTIEEKIDFWRRVMRYGKERNVDFIFVTWNIFVYGTEGKYSITDDIDNQVTIDYFRKSVKQMFLTYPDLAGIGLTTGENMPGATTRMKEDWVFKTYAEGVLDVVKKQPDRKITFIHRQHQTGAAEIARIFEPLIRHDGIEFIFSFKYAYAHVYSSTVQVLHQGFIKDIGNLKTIWTLRNDDNYHFRWGAPDFVREFILNIPYNVSIGYYLGSDQYIWGREFLSTEPETPRQIEIKKHWYHWMLWGRLGFNPALGNDRFIQIIQNRFPDISASDLFCAWQEASMIYPKTTGFHWGGADYQWYIEACQSRPEPAKTPSGFHDINRFITLPPHPGTDYVSIPEYTKSVLSGQKPVGTTPVDLSNQIHGHADKALHILDRLSYGDNKELRFTLEDIRAMAFLGKYYAHKIRGAVELSLLRETLKAEYQNTVISEMNQAAYYWRLYVSTALGQYSNPLWTNRVGYVDWRKSFDHVLYDITIVGGEPEFDSMAPTKGGTILEAENAFTNGTMKTDGVQGCTGTGCLDFRRTEGIPWVEWIYEAPESGNYILEIRYTLRRQRRYSGTLTVNEKSAGDVVFWQTGSSNIWVWDRKKIVLNEGRNTIRITPGKDILIDHINVL